MSIFLLSRKEKLLETVLQGGERTVDGTDGMWHTEIENLPAMQQCPAEKNNI